jgi:hypothetical protein
LDWHVTKGSTIERLPKVFWPLALAARNARQPAAAAIGGITTRHNDDFRLTPAFTPWPRRPRAGIIKFPPVRGCGLNRRRFEGDWSIRHRPVVSRPPSCGQRGAGDGRSLHLFYTFLSTTPNPKGEQQQDVEPSPFYATSVENVRRNFAEWPRVHLHVGNVFETLPEAPIERIAFLHVDMNHHDAESFGIRRLWPMLSKGAVMLLDDYAHYNCRMQYRAVNALAAEIGFDVLSTTTGQGMVVK